MCGIPATLYSDHGPDFTSAHMTQVCADLKIQFIHSTPGKPRGRGKGERFFGTVTTELLPTLPGHIPPGNRGRPVTKPALTLSQVDTAIGARDRCFRARRICFSEVRLRCLRLDE